jgi:hypothetical protein
MDRTTLFDFRKVMSSPKWPQASSAGHSEKGYQQISTDSHLYEKSSASDIADEDGSHAERLVRSGRRPRISPRMKSLLYMLIGFWGGIATVLVLSYAANKVQHSKALSPIPSSKPHCLYSLSPFYNTKD